MVVAPAANAILLKADDSIRHSSRHDPGYREMNTAGDFHRTCAPATLPTLVSRTFPGHDRSITADINDA
jgi:hypothetical protein